MNKDKKVNKKIKKIIHHQDLFCRVAVSKTIVCFQGFPIWKAFLHRRDLIMLNIFHNLFKGGAGVYYKILNLVFLLCKK